MYMDMYMYVNNVYIYNVNNVCTQTIKPSERGTSHKLLSRTFIVCCHTSIFYTFLYKSRLFTAVLIYTNNTI